MDTDTNIITEMQSRITQLEIKLAYLENFIDELQDVTVQQNKNMDRLKAENLNMSEKIAEISEQFESDIPNRRPPHY
jgi:SlyX protein